jgi:glucuronoarabinoxylan endo-1,4-beta-xylanase
MAVDGANAWLYWWMISLNADDEGLASEKDYHVGVVAKRAYALAQYSRFVRPGYHRIEATHLPQKGVKLSAYKSKGGDRLSIVVLNLNRSSLSQNIIIKGLVGLQSVTPYVTSSGSNIEQKKSLSLRSNGFAYQLPASSITTFVVTATR